MDIRIGDIVQVFETFAPLGYQEDYDNSGLFYGDTNTYVSGILITLDVTEAVLDEAIKKNCNLIVSHHPIAIRGIKQLRGNSEQERIIVKAIENHIALYSAHTNADAVSTGVSGKMAEKLGLVNCEVLQPGKGNLTKLAVFVPESHAYTVRQAIFDAGSGTIGAYDQCSFNIKGNGTFRAGEESNPYVGEKGLLHTEAEVRIETILPSHLTGKVVKAMIQAHPYEEVAYDLYPLLNNNAGQGFGIFGELSHPEDETAFLKKVKTIFNCSCIRHTQLLSKPIKKVALCGGSGSSLLKNALSSGADLFITGDFKYHQFFEAEQKIVIADIGHYESEQFTKELFFELLTKKFPNFAVHLSEVNSNPIKYL
jgi:dinuclear metal center YbgI/SA1388 family protein